MACRHGLQLCARPRPPQHLALVARRREHLVDLPEKLVKGLGVRRRRPANREPDPPADPPSPPPRDRNYPTLPRARARPKPRPPLPRLDVEERVARVFEERELLRTAPRADDEGSPSVDPSPLPLLADFPLTRIPSSPPSSLCPRQALHLVNPPGRAAAGSRESPGAAGPRQVAHPARSRQVIGEVPEKSSRSLRRVRTPPRWSVKGTPRRRPPRRSSGGPTAWTRFLPEVDARCRRVAPLPFSSRRRRRDR